MSGTPRNARRRSTLTAAVLAWGLAGAATAQSSQYTAPGALADKPRTSRERLEESMAEARWELGRVKVRPRIWLRNLSYVDNVFSTPDGEEQTSDLRGTLGAGLDAFVHLGPKVVFTAYALPEYNYWREQSQLSGLTGRYGAGLFGFFNRLTVSVDAASLERERPLSSEFEVPVQIRQERGRVAVELDLGGPFRLFGSAVDARVRHSDDAANDVPEIRFAELDRDETVTEAGVLVDSSRGWSVGVGAERSETDFAVDPDGRSNTATSPLLRLRVQRAPLTVDLEAVLRQIEFESRALGEVDELTGRGLVSWELGPRTGLALYGGRKFVYSAADPGNYFTETRYGLRARRRLGPRMEVSLFGESGEDEFGEPGSFAGLRVDDYEAFGGAIDLAFAERGTLRLGYSETRYDSNLPEFDRTAASLQIGVAISGDDLPF